MNTRRCQLLVCGLGFGILVASTAFADAPRAKPSADSEARGHSGFKRVRAEILRKTLGLDEKGATTVEEVLDRYAPERKNLRKIMQQQQDALSQLLEQNSHDQAAYRRALDALATQQIKLNTLRQAEQAELGKWMTPKQQAQLLAVMAKARRARHGE